MGALAGALTMCRGTSLIRNSALLEPYSRPMHGALWWVLGGCVFLSVRYPCSADDGLVAGTNFDKVDEWVQKYR